MAEIQEELDGLQACIDVVSFVGPSNFLHGAWEEELRHSADRFNQQYLRYSETLQEYPRELVESGDVEGEWKDPAEAHARVVRIQAQEKRALERGFLLAGENKAKFKVCRWGLVFKRKVDTCIYNIKVLRILPPLTHWASAREAVMQFLGLLSMSFMLEPAGSALFNPYDCVRPRTLSTPWHTQWKLTLQQVKSTLVALTRGMNSNVDFLFEGYRREQVDRLRRLTPAYARSWGRWCTVSADADTLCMRELLHSI